MVLPGTEYIHYDYSSQNIVDFWLVDVQNVELFAI